MGCNCKQRNIPSKKNNQKKSIFFEMNLPKTIYTDILNMPDPMNLGLSIRYYNNTTENLYFKFFVEGTNWSSNSQTLGILNAGNNEYENFDDFTSRSKPAGETQETLHFTLKAYDDAGYTNERYSFSRDTTIIFIKSDDGTWTEDFNDTFETGIDGWAWSWIHEGHVTDNASLAKNGGHKVEGSFALKATINTFFACLGIGDGWRRHIRLYKSYNTPNKNTVYAIINVYVICAEACPIGGTANFCCFKTLDVKADDSHLIRIGNVPTPNCQDQSEYGSADQFPRNKWMRIVVPIPANQSVELRVEVCAHTYSDGGGLEHSVWLDDIKIISRD